MEDSSWISDLEVALSDCTASGCDIDIVRSITKCKEVPERLRPRVWQICLGAAGRKGSSSAAATTFDEIFDLPEQEILRAECGQLVDKLGNEEEDKVSIVSDLESVLTCFSKKRCLKYETSNGWLEVLGPLLALKLTRVELYGCFDAIVTKYVPSNCNKNEHLFHLFRLLVLYHDPQLCSFLDTKKISPDMFAGGWFRSLFASSCSLNVVHAMWDIYFQQEDQFFVCFLALVILVNAKDQLLAKAMDSRQTIIDLLSSVPSALEEEDVEDFCSLALYYYMRTPISFKKDYHHLLFVTNDSSKRRNDINDENAEQLQHQNGSGDFQVVSQALCLPVSVEELTQSTIKSEEPSSVRFFLVDCRPAQQYNAGHLPTAFHLDANLMLQEPQSFATAVGALSAAQRQAIAAGSRAAGEHLCFMGSGREEEDQYVHMVVASFLQKHCQYVSMARGGYTAIHDLLRDELNSGLVEHSSRTCIACNSERDISNDKDEADHLQRGNSMFGKLSSVVRSKSAEMKEKMVEFIKNPNNQSSGAGFGTTTSMSSTAAVSNGRHVSSSDRAGKRYRNVASVFTIDDDHDEAEGMVAEDEDQEVVGVQAWLKKSDVVASFKCKEVKKSGFMYPCYLLVTATHLYVLRLLVEEERGGGSGGEMARIASRRALSSVVKITSKKRHPDLVTFKYGTVDGDKVTVTDLDLFLIPKASDATRLVRQQILNLLKGD